jgi:hypothetical protein
MKKAVVFLVVIMGFYFYFTWKPSASGIAEDMRIGEEITHNGITYNSKWGESETIEGFVRRKDRHYDEHMPIVTYDIVISTGEYSDRNLVKIQNKGGGNYYWSASRQPKGTLAVYHTVPATPAVQRKLDTIEPDETISLRAKVSQNSEIKGSNGSFVKLGHSNHKFIIVEDL